MKSKIISFIILCSLFLSSSAWGIWTTQESGTTQDLNAILTLDGALGFSAGKSGTLLRTVNGGVSWETLPIGTATIEYNDVFFPVSTEGYVLGTAGVITTSDEGQNFAPLTFASIPASANFLRGAYYLANRAMVASNGASADSYLIESSDSGTNWLISTLTDLEVKGVFLSAGGGASVATWVWGKYFAGTEAGNNVILKRINSGAFSIVYRNASNGIRDLYFVDDQNGFAVGDSGLFIRTDDGGSTWTTVIVKDENNSPISSNLNSLYFVNPSFGWICGNGGTIAVTATAGTSWNTYPLSAPLPDLKDISVITSNGGGTGLITALAFIAGTNGTILNLVSPTILSILPTSEPQGWIGEVEISGEGFMSNGEVFFTKPGTDESDPSIIVLSTSFESAMKLKALIMIEPTAETTYLRDVMALNPDATASKETGAFTVTASTDAVSIEGVHIDGNPYPAIYTLITGEPIVDRNPSFSFEVSSTNGVSLQTLHPRIIARYTNTLGNRVNIVQDIPQANLTEQGDRIVVHNTSLIRTLPYDTPVELGVYAEDTAGNVGIVYYHARTGEEGVIADPGSSVVSADRIVHGRPGNWRATIYTKGHIKLPRFIRAVIAGPSQVYYNELLDTGSVSVSQLPSGDLVNFSIPMENIGIGGNVTAQLVAVRLYDENGRLLGKTVVPMVPLNMIR